MTSLRLLGTVGEPINPEAWMWYHKVIGGERCPIVDTWWQTETGGIMISPLPGATPTKPGSGTLPFFGILPEVVDKEGNEVPPQQPAASSSSASPGPRCCARLSKIPTATSNLLEARFPGSYFTGDGARQDEDGYFWIMGRIDDVLNVAGHRSAPPKSKAPSSRIPVAEAAVVGRPDELKGQALCRLRHPEGRAPVRRTPPASTA
jgi:acetyl-CoA synthetase